MWRGLLASSRGLMLGRAAAATKLACVSTIAQGRMVMPWRKVARARKVRGSEKRISPRGGGPRLSRQGDR